jgi:hypothetical protein
VSTTTQPRLNRKLAVKIAKDVLAQLRLNRFQASQGRYCTISLGRNEDGYMESVDEYTSPAKRRASFKTAFKENKEMKCEVCALGALFTSFVNINNVFTVGQVVQPQFSRMFGALEDAFPLRDLLLMEYVFEEGERGILEGKVANPGWNEYTETSVRFRNRKFTFTREELQRAIDYAGNYDDSDKRLRAIMINVIRNKGTFKLPLRVR